MTFCMLLTVLRYPDAGQWSSRRWRACDRAARIFRDHTWPRLRQSIRAEIVDELDAERRWEWEGGR